jgi:hypothetical protein
VIAPIELGELEAFRSILASEPQLEVEGALCPEPRYVRHNYLSSQEADTSGTRA